MRIMIPDAMSDLGSRPKARRSVFPSFPERRAHGRRCWNETTEQADHERSEGSDRTNLHRMRISGRQDLSVLPM